MENKVILKKYIDWKVYNVTKLRDKYGFRLILYFEDNSELTQQIGGFKTQKEAKEEREKIVTELNNGNYVVDKDIKMKDFLLYWIENIIKPEKTYNTYIGYKNAITKHIINHIGNLKLSKLNKGHIQSIYNIEVEISRDVAETVKTVLNSALKYAEKNNLIKTNPALNVNLPKSKNISTKKQKYNTLTLEQVKTLVKESKGTKIHLQVLFAALMGFRNSEINGLKYSDIDYIHRTINVERQLGVKANSKNTDFKPKTYTKQEIELKTKSSYRQLVIPDYVFEEILKEKKKYEANKKRRINDKTDPFLDEGYICCSTYGKPRCRNYNWQHFKKLLEKCHFKDMRWHDLRHTYSTILLKNDFNVKAIAKQLGHSKEIITADIYGDTQEIIEDCLDVLEPYISKIIEKDEENQLDYSTDEESLSIVENYCEKMNIVNL